VLPAFLACQLLMVFKAYLPTCLPTCLP